MAVDLEDLIPALQAEVTPLGSLVYDNVTKPQWVAQLNNAFWEAVLDNIIVGYTNNDGLVIPTVSGGPDISPALQQVIVFYAGVKVITNQLREIRTRFSTAAGPVKYEVEQSATVLKGLLDALMSRRATMLATLAASQQSAGYGTYIGDIMQNRDASLRNEFLYWWS